MKHPMQPIEVAEDHVIRFKRNNIVEFMLETGRAAGIFDLNRIAMLPFSDEDRMQLAQLIGYSVSGFGELSYASEEVVNAADEIAATLYAEAENNG